MKRFAVVINCIILLSGTVMADELKGSLTLNGVIQYALIHNPALRVAQRDIEIEEHWIEAARGARMPLLDLYSTIKRTLYDSPVTPISGSPLDDGGFPEFDNTVYGFGVTLMLPVYKGGRLEKGITIAEMKMSIAEDIFKMNRHELVYNITSLYYKILQLERLMDAHEATVRELEAHRERVEDLLKAGTVPRIELLKTETELAHARQMVIIVRNSIEGSYELLKTYMGMEDGSAFSLIDEVPGENEVAGGILGSDGIDAAIKRALSQRSDYSAVKKGLSLLEKRLISTECKRLPSVYLSGEYAGRSGGDIDFKEDWNIGLIMTLPLFDGGITGSEIMRVKKEIEKAKEEERALRLSIIREIRDAGLAVENARERRGVAEMAIQTARENLRVELLKFQTGAGTSTDIIDAQSVLLRAETDYYQALYDEHIAIASLRRAIGEDKYTGVSE